jgi:urea transporter
MPNWSRWSAASAGARGAARPGWLLSVTPHPVMSLRRARSVWPFCSAAAASSAERHLLSHGGGWVAASAAFQPRPRHVRCAPLSTDQREEPPSADDETSTPIPAALRDNLVGMGQVVFCNSAASGGLIVTGLMAHDVATGSFPILASMSLLSLCSATATARVAGIDDDMVSNGLASYNGALVGCAFTVFLPETLPTAALAAASAAGGATTSILAVALKNTLTMPQWTFAFNFTTLPALLYVQPFNKPTAADSSSADTAAAVVAEVAATQPTTAEWITSPLVGISQIFVVESALSGALILAGIAVYSRECAAHTLLGSSVGIATGVALGVDPSALTAGLWSYNPALTSLAVSVFFVPSPATLALSVGGAATTTALASGLGPVFGTFGSPALTLPFCLGVSGCYMLRDSIPAIVPAANPHSPEINRVTYDQSDTETTTTS